MTKLDEYLELRLQEWADWFKDGDHTKALGFPKETIEYKVMREGLFAAARTGLRGTLPANTRAEEIESFVSFIHKENPKQCMVIRARYFAPRKTPVEAIAARIRMNKRTFEDQLKLAKYFIRGCLSVSSHFVQ